MRILHSVQDFTRSGGIGTYLLALVEEQKRLGHEVKVECARHDPGSLDVIEAGSSEEFLPDIIHAHDYWRHRWDGAAAIVRSLHNHDFACSSRTRYLRDGKPCFKAHGIACVAHWPSCSHSPRVDKRLSDYRATSRNLKSVLGADAVVAYSRYVGETAVLNGVSDSKVMILPCPITRFDANVDYGLASPGLVTYFGRLARPKGVEDLIEAVGVLPNVSLRIVGDGYLRSKLERMAASLAPGRVDFHGWAAEDELPRLYQESAVVVMPGRWPEPFGLVGLEAAWAGRPVIASASGGILDWLLPGETGLATKPGDVPDLTQAIEYVTSDTGQAERMGLSARRHLEDWPNSADHAETLVSEVYGAAIREAS